MGAGTRKEIHNPNLPGWLRTRSEECDFVASVCTGSALLAVAGVLDGRRATTNKRVFDWVASCGDRVEWQRRARWVEDGKFFTSSGVSAGMDMALALIEKIRGREAADEAALRAEFEWNRDSARDPFAH